MSEVWKRLNDYEWDRTYYEVSNTGKIRSVMALVGGGTRIRVLRTTINKFGYVAKAIKCRGGKLKTARIHQLVATTFMGPPPKGLEVNHKDGNKLNNHVSNLEYCTRGENIAHAYAKKLRTPLFGTRGGIAKLNDHDIPVIRMLGKLKMKRKHIAAWYGVRPETIKAIKLGRTWKHIP